MALEEIRRILPKLLLCSLGAPALGTVGACRDAVPEARTSVAADSAVRATDDVGRQLLLPRPARRVVSLLPAGTEILLALGAVDQVVGRTRYDTDPRVGDLPSVGGGLDPSLESLVALRPDLVIAFEAAGASNIRPKIEALGIPVFAIQTQDTSDIFRNIRNLGALTGRAGAADSLLGTLRSRLASVRGSVAPGPRPRVLYVASIDPPIVAGPGTFVAELLSVAGGVPVPAEGARRLPWPQLSLEEIVRQQPDVVMLPVGEDPTASVERLRREPGWRDLAAVREGRVAVVPADLMNRPGPGIAEAAERMRQALRRIGERR